MKLVSVGHHANSWTSAYDQIPHPLHGEDADRSGGHRISDPEHRVTGLDVLSPAPDVPFRVGFLEEGDFPIPAIIRMLDAHDSRRTLGHRGSGHDPRHRPSGQRA
jgi:hypothetical protein